MANGSTIPAVAAVASGATAFSNLAGGLTGIANLLLVTPQNTVGYQPQNTVGEVYNAPALLFHYEGENTSTFESDITDHFVEDNTAIQDQIALKPVIVTVQGFVGELNDIPPNKVLQAAYVAANKLTTISAYSPVLSTTALIAYNEALFAYQTAANLAQTAVSAYSSITGSGSSGTSVIGANGINPQPNQTQQQIYYQQFFYYWGNRILFTIQTPWAIFQDMAILSVRAIQQAETTMISDFEVKFKQIRFAKTLTVAELYQDNANFAGRLNQQGAPLTQLGTNAVTQSANTFANSLINSLVIK